MRRFIGVLLACVLLAGCGGGSEDGKIAFESDRDGDLEIFVMNADGTGVTQLTNNDADDWHPVWSPNGKQIAFQGDRDGDDEIFVMNADGTGGTQLTDHDADDWGPVWSPNGKQIAFQSDRYGDDEIFVMDADGSNVVSLGQQGYATSWGG